MKKLTICLCLLVVGLVGCESCDTCDPCGGCIDTQPPAVPTGVRTITGDTYVIVQWDPVYVDDLMGYGVYRSRLPDGPYYRIGDVAWDEETEFWDEGLTNGITYYYAVDAYDVSGNESDLSYELVDDTPRPEGWDLQWFAKEFNADESAIAILPEQYDTIVMLRFDHPWAQYYLTRSAEGLLRIVPKPMSGHQIQDYGYTYSEDDISEASIDGWSASADGVEVIASHTYILRTVDGYYGKIWIDTMGPNWVIVYWAFQGQRWSTELAPPRLRS
jgi:hypothetical protein